MGVPFGDRGDDVPWRLLVALVNPQNHILPCVLSSIAGKLRHRACSAWNHQCFPIPPQP